MMQSITRRGFALIGTGLTLGSMAHRAVAEEPPLTPPGPVEATSEHDYPAPDFKPS